MKSEVRVLPELFLERLRRCVPIHKWDSIANTFAQDKPVSFRVNTLKASLREVRVKLEESGLGVDPVSWCAGAFMLRHGSLRNLQETGCYKQGEIYVQNLSSMIPPLVLDPQPGEDILDLTAAPGSKTTQLAALMQGEGRVVANDNNRVRFFRLKANVELLGARNVELMLAYGESLGRRYPGRFDRVLVDAPCTAEGRFDVHNPRTYRYWKPAKIREMARKQVKLLFAGLKALRPGGVLVYSTCTFAPEENEAVLDRVLGKFDGRLELEPMNLAITNRMPGMKTWGEKRYVEELRKSMRVLPTEKMEGFFIARIRKK